MEQLTNRLVRRRRVEKVEKRGERTNLAILRRARRRGEQRRRGDLAAGARPVPMAGRSQEGKERERRREEGERKRERERESGRRRE